MKISVPLPRRDLGAALLKIADRRRLNWINAADYAELGTIEGIAHELAHTLDLGPNFEVQLRAMGDVEANEHEIAALRIELTALARLGVRLSPRRLWLFANWREIGRPSLTQLRAPLTQHESNCVRCFVAAVRRTARHET